MSRLRIFGSSFIENHGGVFYAAMDKDGTAKSFEQKPIFKDGVWIKGDFGGMNIYGKVKLVPEKVNAAECLWDYDDVFDNHITEENWKTFSLTNDFCPDTEVKRLLKEYAFNKERKGQKFMSSNINPQWEKENIQNGNNLEKEILDLFRFLRSKINK